jgi:hypothetical protein
VADFLVRFGSMVLAVAACLWACVGDLQTVDTSSIAWGLGFTLTLLTALFAPMPASTGAALLRAMGWSSLTAALAFAVPVATGMAAPLAAASLGIVVWLASLALQLLLACAVGLARSSEHTTARVAVTSVYAALSAAPLWLGPAAQLLGSQSGWPSRIVALSPAAHLASALECDLLRTTWFYAHTPIGGLRFDYPQFSAIALSYAAATVLLAVCFQLAARRPGAMALGLQFARS